ncbi:glycoside hydrolase family 65 protein, partial [Ralstonia sp. RL]|uniref:glycoside hydrolase family 65 protein n=1 Tax=Ralstonia sp. RL TaxID=1839756 RepID=UPI000B20A6AF
MLDDEFTPIREHEFESLFAVSNGYLGSRGSLPFGGAMSAPTVFIAGVFDIIPPSRQPELLALPGWTLLAQRIGPQPLAMAKLAVTGHRRLLDMRHGMFRREFRFGQPDGPVMCISFLRIASLAERHVLLQSSLCVSETYSGPMEIRSGFLLTPGMSGDAFAPVVTCRDTPYGPVQVFEHRTRTGTSIAMALATRFCVADGGDACTGRSAGRLDQTLEIVVEAGKTYRNDWFQVCYTSRDTGQPSEAALAQLQRLLAEGAPAAVRRHAAAWERRWETAGVEVSGDPEAQRALRFACYHLVSAANPGDEHVSIGARALTGAGYKGHVFWDTEIYLLPFYTLTDPASARALLMYRYHTLDAARENARRRGYAGALYAWESADSGEDVTPSHAVAPTGEVLPVLTGAQAHHISADVAYAVWQYWQASGDDEFLGGPGGEMLLETARFWASRGRIEADGRYHIRQVIGPDEYHDGVDDNAYTNWMAQWNLECAAAAARILQERWTQRWRALSARVGLGADEVRTWRSIAAAMYAGI